MDIRNTLDETSSRLSDKTAIIHRNQRISFGELRRQASSLSRALRKYGVRQGDKVALFLPNCPEFAISYLAALQMGAIAIPIDIRLTKEEIGSIIRDWHVSTIIFNHPSVDTVRELKKEINDLLGIIRVGNDQKRYDDILHYEDLIQYPGEIDWDTKIQGNDDALILYTSGTTGHPKGVVLTFDHLDCFPRTMTEFWSKEDDIVALVMPMSHISGPIFINLMIHVGNTLIIFDTIRPETILETIEKERINWFHGVPPIFQALVKVNPDKHYDTSSLQFIAMMGAPVPLSLMKEFKDRYPGVKVIQGYGLTETSPLVTLIPLEMWEEKLGSAGKPLSDVEMEVVDEDDNILPPGKVGEVIIKGPHVMKGYYNDPEATAQVVKDGWFYTGDLGKFDSDNYLYLVGRKKDIIISGGLNVYPLEIEECLLRHPSIAEVAVIGVPDFMRGERVKAIIVPTTRNELSKKDVQSYCRKHLADFKIPDFIEFREHLPKTGSGKIARANLY